MCHIIFLLFTKQHFIIDMSSAKVDKLKNADHVLTFFCLYLVFLKLLCKCLSSTLKCICVTVCHPTLEMLTEHISSFALKVVGREMVYDCKHLGESEVEWKDSVTNLFHDVLHSFLGKAWFL